MRIKNSIYALTLSIGFSQLAFAQEIAPVGDPTNIVTSESKPEIEQSAMTGPADATEVLTEMPASTLDVAEVSYDYLLMSPNAEVVFITTGGAEMRADWSAAAKDNLGTSFRAQIEEKGHSVIDFDSEAERDDAMEQLLLLYEVTSQSANLNMPHKGKGLRNNTDLSIGENAVLLKAAYGADSAMFVDHYSQIESGGVFMTQVLIGAATGYVPASQNMRATIGTVVDLDTGEFVSRNLAMMGDARDVGEASGIVSRVMKNLTVD